MQIDLPPHLQERVACSIAAAVKYGIPANIMLAVAEKEGGKAGQWVRNGNGTHDVGPLQFNTSYLHQLSRYGITPGDVASGGCYAYDLAAWRLRQHIRQDGGDLWTRCANYHSRTPRFNRAYRADLVRKAIHWAHWLAQRYPAGTVFSMAAPVAWDAGVKPVPRLKPSKRLADAAPEGPPGYVPRALVGVNPP